MSRVVVVKYNEKRNQTGLSTDIYRRLLSSGLLLLSGAERPRDAIRRYLPSGVIGIKPNCLAGKYNSTPPALATALCDMLVEAGFDENDLVIWERSSGELARAGYVLNAGTRGRRCMGSDANGLGYSRQFYTSGEVNSLVTRILTDLVDYNVNLPVLKDHSIAGMSAGMKNMYGAVHNPNKYHGDSCNPFCAHVSNLDPVRSKTRLIILDAVRVQYHGGPGYVPDYVAEYNGVLISDDPVAVDRVGLAVLERLRADNGQPSLKEVGRPVKYLETAQQIGLGTADMKQIDLKVVTVNADGSHTAGELF